MWIKIDPHVGIENMNLNRMWLKSYKSQLFCMDVKYQLN